MSEVRTADLTLISGDASVVVAERAGFQREGVARSRYPFGDEFVDVLVDSLARGDWCLLTAVVDAHNLVKSSA